ncbi:hypothetical protein BGZ65_003310 [Modicella reniformis]|uniref:F-box domain-containing protein n=1 Tax=Modicella reniformis TaxID=1440133 RepID=A0A9P6MI87_9FUNG|nr:hypothetical protein BGZ65_003310 [Modicella reniformis]
MNPVSRNPLDLSEIRKRLSLFLTSKDALACARVCRTWSKDFLSAIWHTIEDSSQTKLAALDPSIIAKHGHHIRVLKSLPPQGKLLDMLQDTSVSNLKSLSIVTTPTQVLLAHYYDIIRRNVGSLKMVNLSFPRPNGVGVYFVTESLSPQTHTGDTSKLSYLKLQGLQMTRTAFSMLLQSCPVLEHIDMYDTVLHSAINMDKYQHPRLSKLTAPIEQVFSPDPAMTTAPSLLIHFPNLSQWETWQISQTLNIDIDMINKEITRCLSNFTVIHTRPGGLSLANMLIYGFKGLTEICVPHKHLSPEFIIATLNHQETLTTFMTTPPSSDTFFQPNSNQQIPAVEDFLTSSGWMLHFIPRECSRLKKISLPTHGIRMDDVDKIGWMCNDLEILHIRVKGLDTEEQINVTLKMWLKAKNSARRNSKPDLSAYDLYYHSQERDERYVSIEARVARHLLKFEKLHTVWLGTKVWRA